MKKSGGEVLLEVLEASGVAKIFCSPGTEWAPVWEALAQRKEAGNTALDYMNVRHESLAVSLAQGYAETSGRVPAVLLHAGVGPLQGAMALRNAVNARVPMLVFGGETSEHWGDEEIRAQGGHWLGLLSDIGGPSAAAKSFTKWSNRVQSHDALADTVLRGYEIASSAPAGPVFISVPAELLLRRRETRDAGRSVSVRPTPAPDRNALRDVAKRLAAAERPVIISEHAGKDPKAIGPLTALAELTGAAVYECTFPYRSAFPKDHPLYQGMEAMAALKEADVVLVAGGLTPWYPPKAGPGEDAYVIVIDEAPWMERLPHWGYCAHATVAAAITPSLALLAELVKEESGGKELNAERKAALAAQHDAYVQKLEDDAVALKDERPIAPRWFLREARAALPDDAVIVDETIMHTRAIFQYTARPDHYVKAAYGGLGIGMGEALGVKLTHPDQPVVLMVGDGAFNYNPVPAGLGFAQEYGTPLLIMVFNNGGYKAMGMGHRFMFPEGAAVRRDDWYGVHINPAPDYAKLAEAFGGYGEKLEDPAGIRGAISRCLEKVKGGQTVVLDVVLGEHGGGRPGAH